MKNRKEPVDGNSVPIAPFSDFVDIAVVVVVVLTQLLFSL